MKRITNVISIFILLFLYGCEPESYRSFEESQVKINQSDVTFTAAGGTGEIVVATSGQFTATVDQANRSWCSVSIAGNKITVTVEPNMSNMTRSANITIQAGDKINFVPVSQTPVYIRLGSYEAIHFLGKAGSWAIPYQCDVPVTVTAADSWISGYTQDGQIVLEAGQNPSLLESRKTQVTLIAGNNLVSVKLEVNQDPGLYYALLGDYTMSYATSNVPPANRTRTATVTLVEGTPGATYYLKGILSNDDEALGNIIVNLNNKSTGLELEICGQIICLRAGTNYDFWLLPYSQPVNGGNYVTRSTTVGIASMTLEETDDGKISFTMQDNGVWPAGSGPDYLCAGFILRNYEGSASMGNINGKDGQANYFYPMFEKQ